MANIIDSASSIMSLAERRTEVSAQNIANVSTFGYRRRMSFANMVTQHNSGIGAAEVSGVSLDLTAGKLITTGRPFDLAIAGKGFFAVSKDGRTFYTRQGQFQLDGAGRLMTASGYALQVQGGGDLVLHGSQANVLEDGSVVELGEPTAKIEIVDINPQAASIAEGEMIAAESSAVKPIDTPSVHQGMLEASNVSMGAEMVTVMAALRQAETGQRLATLYDDLMGRVLTSIGQSS